MRFSTTLTYSILAMGIMFIVFATINHTNNTIDSFNDTELKEIFEPFQVFFGSGIVIFIIVSASVLFLFIWFIPAVLPKNTKEEDKKPKEEKEKQEKKQKEKKSFGPKTWGGD